MPDEAKQSIGVAVSSATTFLVYRVAAYQERLPAKTLPPEFSLEWEKPSSILKRVSTHSPKHSAIYTLFHKTGIFRTQDFSVMLVMHKGKVVHGSTVFPAFFRFPFMEPSDLQIGMLYTEPEFRGQGLAMAAVARIISDQQFLNRTFWYVVGEDNAPSIQVAKRTGFQLFGKSQRKKRLGSNFLGAYVIEDVVRVCDSAG